MATSSSESETANPGIIIPANSEVGKSYNCNIFIGNDRLKAEFQSEPVTIKTEHHCVFLGSKFFCIYNIPGLVEVNPEHIDRNKQEIMKAIAQSPVSVVIFVWTQIGGHAQQDNVIVFNYLNNAYKFLARSLMFVVNNVPRRRSREYEGQFIGILSNMLKPMLISMGDIIFIDTILRVRVSLI
jgi:hypothetical protein